MSKGRGHNSWWLRRGTGGRFRSQHADWIASMERQTAELYAYAKVLLLALLDRFQDDIELLAFLSDHLDGRPTEVYEATRAFCIEQGMVQPCPDCDGRLAPREELRCETCDGRGYVIEDTAERK